MSKDRYTDETRQRRTVRAPPLPAYSNRAALTSRRAWQELAEVALVVAALKERHDERSDRAHDLRDLVRLEVGALWPRVSVETLRTLGVR